jgi:hypothetical protein
MLKVSISPQVRSLNSDENLSHFNDEEFPFSPSSDTRDSRKTRGVKKACHVSSQIKFPSVGVGENHLYFNVLEFSFEEFFRGEGEK